MLFSRLSFLLFFLLQLSLGGIKAQNPLIVVSSNVPSSLNVCGSSQLFSININNPSAGAVTGTQVTVTMPTGVIYQAGSITNAGEVNIGNLSAPTFSVSTINSLNNITLTFLASVNCNINTFLATGNPIQNTITVNYTGNSQNFTLNHTTGVYSIYQPNLSITTFTNQTYAGTVGGAFTRCFNIVNGGLGALNQFTVTDVHGNGLTITSVSPGTLSTNGNTETIILSGADFTSIGDGDNLFENGENITICENVTINNCSAVTSNITAGWGCNGSVCQSSSTTANITFPGVTPQLTFSTVASQNFCLGAGNDSKQKLIITNHPNAGTATNLILNIHQSDGGSFYCGMKMLSEIVVSSLQIKYNNGTPTTIVPTSSLTCSNVSCLGANSVGFVKLTIPQINPGDSVIITWDVRTCCEVNTVNNGWRYDATYQDVCQNNFVKPLTLGRFYNLVRGDLSNNNSPSNIISGQTKKFSFLITTHYNNVSPTGPGANWQAEFQLPPCLTYNNTPIYILDADGITQWPAASVNQVGNTVTATFNGSPSSGVIEQSQILIDLTANCSSCSGGIDSVQASLYYVPTTTNCTCRALVSKASAILSIVCPVSCEGLNFSNYEVYRTSLGSPDNNDDGVDDGFGNLNFNKIRRDRSMFGDTVETSFQATIQTSVQNPQWQYLYAQSTITNSNYITSVGGILKVVRGVNTYTCFIPGVVPTGNTFSYNLSFPLAFNPAITEYQNGDSIFFDPQYKVTSNPGGGNIITSNISNDFYCSDIPNPTNAINKFTCNVFQGNFSIIGYYFTVSGPDNFTTQECDQVVIRQNYYFSVGPCCIYAGVNMFPFEYRNFTGAELLKVVVPNGYAFVAASVREVRTSGLLLSTASPTYPITPISTTGPIFDFNMTPFYQGATPLIYPSDEGFYGTLTLTLSPTCAVTRNVNAPIGYYWTYSKGNGKIDSALVKRQSNAGAGDHVFYDGPDFFLQSALPTIIAPNNSVCWDISLTNITNVNSQNTWIGAQIAGGITINQVTDLTNNNIINPVNGIYQLGNLSGATTNNYRICATFTSCNADSFMLHAGWNCPGYPTSIATYPCSTKTLQLKLIPQIPSFQIAVTPPATAVNLCDTAEYLIKSTNVDLGTAYNVFFNTTLPTGISIVPNTSKISYPIGNTFVGINDPANMGGSNWQWNISADEDTIGANGLKGVLTNTLNSFEIKFKVLTDCNYIVGSNIVFEVKGQSACGINKNAILGLASQLGINGANASFTTNVKLTSTFISACNGNTNLKVSVINNGPGSFVNSDSITIMFPSGVNYVANSFSGIKNPPVVANPTTYFNSLSEYNTWNLPVGVAPGDSVVFTIDFSGLSDSLKCSIYQFFARTVSTSNVLCMQTNNICGVSVLTGYDTLDIYSYKSNLNLSNASGVSVPNPPTGETATINMTINNPGGQQIIPSNPTIISYYFDANNNGIIDAGDNLVVKDTVAALIPTNGSYAYTGIIDVPAGFACSLIASIDSTLNTCSCNSSQIPLSIPLTYLANDTMLCDGELANIGTPAITGYTYTWNSTTGLNNASNSNPQLTASNNGTNVAVTVYTVSVNRLFCSASDTAVVTIVNKPIAMVGNDTSYCGVNTINLNANALIGNYSGTWTQLPGGPTNATINNNTSSNTAITNLQEGTYKFMWTVATGTTCPAASDTIEITLFDLPIANAGGDFSLCGSATSSQLAATPLTVFASGSWQQISGPTTTIFADDSSATTAISGLAAGIYEYEWTVTNGTCPVKKDTTMLRIFSKPIANLQADTTQLCEFGCISFTDLTQSDPLDTIVSWNWDFGNGSNSLQQNPNNCYPTNGAYSISLIVTSNAGCKDTSTVNNMITVHPTPIANFTVTPVNPSISAPSINLTNGSTGYTNFVWNFGDNTLDSLNTNATHTYDTEVPTDYTIGLYLVNQFGCVDTAEATVKIGPDWVIWFPNCFTPSGDLINDFFDIKGIGIKEFELWIFDRWGEQIFNSTSLDNKWNGRRDNKLELVQQDVYVWKARVTDIFDQAHQYIGHVTVLR
ncbi:MAG: gliding motility-associated C-terminal domain-containing protein [Bacteroidetes bacterium]|nr:gliding motility-associated C-terminal domain-containing protein [Bacteroidota bacterium]